MKENGSGECLVCRKHGGQVTLAGGAIYEDRVPHLHLHLIGRYPGAPRQYWGPRVDEWPDAPHGAEREIEEVAARVRRFLQQRYG